MKKKLRKSLWGLQWIFLKQEKHQPKSSNRDVSEILALHDPVGSDFEDFPEISMRKLENYQIPDIKINEASTKEKYNMTHIEDLPNLSYKNPHIRLDLKSEKWASKEKKKLFKSFESAKPSRPKTVEIRKVVFPQKTIVRLRKPEINTCTNRRKNYGKWFIPPEHWKKSLDNFLRTSV